MDFNSCYLSEFFITRDNNYPTLMIKSYLFFRKQQTLRMTTLQANKR